MPDEERIREIIREELGAFEKSDRFTFQKDIEINDGRFITTGGTDGTRIGISTNDKIGFWNTTPVIQPTNSVAETNFVANAGTAVNDDSTFGGYTIRQVVQALKDIGLLQT